MLHFLVVFDAELKFLEQIGRRLRRIWYGSEVQTTKRRLFATGLYGLSKTVQTKSVDAEILLKFL